MPVRIYDIAKRLGVESKDVLAKAKALAITAAKVPSSSLDKIPESISKNNFKENLRLYNLVVAARTHPQTDDTAH